jgi:hypothetical protein
MEINKLRNTELIYDWTIFKKRVQRYCIHFSTYAWCIIDFLFLRELTFHIVIPAGLTKWLDTPELKKTPSQFTAMKKPGNKHSLSGTKWAAVQYWISRCAQCSNFNIYQKYEEVLTSSDFYYTVYNRTTATFNYEIDLMFNLSVYCNHFW